MPPSEPPKKKEGEAPAVPAPAAPTRRRFDDKTMVVTPVAPIEGEPKTPEKRRKFDDPTERHVATAPRPTRTKYDDETMRAFAPVSTEAPSAKPKDETLLVQDTPTEPSVPPTAPVPPPVARGIPLVEPTLEMAPEPPPPLVQPSSPAAVPVTRPVARFDPTVTSGLTPVTAAFFPPRSPATRPEPTRTSFVGPETFASEQPPAPDTRRGTVEEIAAALARKHPLPPGRAGTLETGALPSPAPTEPELVTRGPDTAYAPPPATTVDEVAPPPSEGPAETVVPLTRPRREVGDAIAVVHATKFAPFVMHWQLRPPKNAIVVAVKAKIQIAADCPAKSVDAEDPTGDVFSGKTEAASLAYPSDFVTFKPRADVMLIGDAHAPADGGAVGHVRFRFGKHSWDLAVLGDRHWDGSTPSRPEKFKTIPLEWERALGGTLSPDNPVGRGFKTGTLLPNLERPRELITGKRDTPRPVCFAPVSPKWRQRVAKLGRYDRKWLDERWPYLPEDFDYEYFNAAPVEQQVPYPRGDERFEVTGVRPAGAVFEGTLPAIRPQVFAQKSESAGSELLALHMNLDTVLIDARSSVVTLTWRGVLEVSDRDALEIDFVYVEESPVGGGAPDLQAAMARSIALTHRPSVAHSSDPAANDAVPTSPASLPKLRRATVLQWVTDGRSLKGADLTGVDLSGADLTGRDLQGAILRDAVLDGAKLDEANCAGMIACGLSAEGSSWTGADLTKADLTDAKVAKSDFSEANLSYAVAERLQAKGAKFDRVRAANARFPSALLDEASFEGARVPKADFTSASLNRARFARAKMADAKFYEVVGEGVVLDEAELVDFRCEEANLKGISALRVAARGSIWDKSDVTDGTFEGATLTDASFVASTATRTLFNKMSAPQATFRGAKMQRACFLKADLTKASFEQADLRDADLRGATLDHAETWEANLEGANLQQASLAGTKLDGGAR